MKLAMSDTDLEGHTVIESFSYDIAKGARSPIASVPLPQEFFPYLGQISVCWGAFENDFDNFIQAMLNSANRTLESDWRFRALRVRVRKFNELVDDCFSDKAGVRGILKEISHDTIFLQRKRNVLLHGKIHIHLYGGKAKLVAQDRKGVYKFSHDDIIKLFYDISCLWGRIVIICMNPGDSQKWPPITCEEKDFFTKWVRKNHPSFVSS